MDVLSIAAIAMAGVAVLSFLFQQFGVLSGIKERLTALETKTDLFWTAIQAKTIEMLKSPNAPRRDELLDRLDNLTITQPEAMELSRLLSEEVWGRENGDKQMASSLITARLEQIVFEFSRKAR